jgi:hypothetical protein
LRVTLDDNTQYRGPLRSFTAEQVDQRDIALGGAPILRLKPGDDPTTGWEEMKPFDAVILDGSHIRSIAVQFLDADGRSLQAQSPKQRESWLPRFNVRERISERRSRQGEGSTTTPSRRCVLDRHHDNGPAQVKLSGGLLVPVLAFGHLLLVMSVSWPRTCPALGALAVHGGGACSVVDRPPIMTCWTPAAGTAADAAASSGRSLP